MKASDITYRDDEITLIFKGCRSLQELENARKCLGYLNIIGVQRIRPVVLKLVRLKEKQLKRNLNYGKN